MSRALAVAERRPMDAYGTPPALAEAICCLLARRLRRDPPGEVIEPSAGHGPFVRAARSCWPAAHVTAVDVDPLCGAPCLAAGAHRYLAADWPTWARAVASEQAQDGPRRLVLGNPPYTHAEAHAAAALALLRPGDHLALLLRLNFLGSRSRVAFWRSSPLALVVPVAPRPSFTGGGTDATEYAIYLWTAGHRGPARLGRPLVWRGED